MKFSGISALLFVMICSCLNFAWSSEVQREDVIARALDDHEYGGSISSDAKDEFLGRQSMYFISLPVDKRHLFDVGAEAYDYKYQEEVDGSKFMNTQGNYTGYFLEYTYRPDLRDDFNPKNDSDEYRIQARFASGDVDYTGSGTYSGLKDYMYEVRGLVGKRFNLGDVLISVPYLGLGYRYLNNGLEAIPANATTFSGYNRESRYFYFPAGMDFRTRIIGGWDVVMNMEYEKLIRGEQQSHLEDMRDRFGNDPRYSNLTNVQKHGYGLRGSFKLGKDINKKVNVFVEPFVRYWNIGNSDAQTVVVGEVGQCDADGMCYGGLEPANSTREVGLKMGVGF